MPHVSAKWIMKRYYDRIRLNPTWPIKFLIETISQAYNVKFDEKKVRRAKGKVLAAIKGIAAD